MPLLRREKNVRVHTRLLGLMHLQEGKTYTQVARPRVIRQQQYQYAYLFGAVCPAQDKAVGLVMPQVNTQAMQSHLRLIAKQVPAGRHAVVILDRAGWHTTAKLKNYTHLSLRFLPPASPELNPTEQVWQQLRDRFLANRCFADYEDIVNSSCKAWNQFVSEPERIRKLCTREWANLQVYFM